MTFGNDCRNFLPATDLSNASDCNFPSAHDQSEALPRSGYWQLNSMKFPQSFLRRHFTGKPVMVVLTICREGSARREGGKEVPFLLARLGPRVSLAPKTPFPFPSKRLPRRLHFSQITHAADSRPAW